MPVVSHFIAQKGLGVLAAAILLAGCSGSGAEKQGPGRPPAQVGVVSLAEQSYEQTTSLPGRTTAYLTADVRPQINGIIQKRLFEEGSDVKAGQVLYQIESAPYQAAYDSARGALAKSEAAVLSARPQAQRYTELNKIDAISQQALDSAVATLKQDEAAVISAKADLETARINLAFTRITAPISGRIGSSAYTPGQLVTANQSAALSTIQQLDPVYVDVTQSSMQVLQLRKNLASGRLKQDVTGAAKIQLVLEDGSTYAREGTLQFSGVSVDQSTGTITLRAMVQNPDKLLLPGMYVHAVLEEGVNQQALRVPQQGVTHNAKGEATALVVGSGDRVEERVVQVAGTQGSDWIVTDGLKAGDRVIVEGLQSVRVGDAVQVQQAGSGPVATGSPSELATAVSAPH